VRATVWKGGGLVDAPGGWVGRRPNTRIVRPAVRTSVWRSGRWRTLARRFLAAGLITREELARVLGEMQRVADDETVLAVMPQMSQVWARNLLPCASATG